MLSVTSHPDFRPSHPRDRTFGFASHARLSKPTSWGSQCRPSSASSSAGFWPPPLPRPSTVLPSSPATAIVSEATTQTPPFHRADHPQEPPSTMATSSSRASATSSASRSALSTATAISTATPRAASGESPSSSTSPTRSTPAPPTRASSSVPPRPSYRAYTRRSRTQTRRMRAPQSSMTGATRVTPSAGTSTSRCMA